MELIFEMLAVDGLSSCACSCRISALDHEVPDNAVELGSLVALTDGLLLGQLDEVLGRDGNGLSEDADHNGSDRNSADFDVEENLMKIQFVRKISPVVCCF